MEKQMVACESLLSKLIVRAHSCVFKADMHEDNYEMFCVIRFNFSGIT